MKPSAGNDSLLSEDPPILPGSWPKSTKSDSKSQGNHILPPKRQPRGVFKASPSCEGCLEEHYKCVLTVDEGSCSRCRQMDRACSFSLKQQEHTKEAIAEYINLPVPEIESESWMPPFGLPDILPQNQRLVSSLMENVKPRKPLSFAASDAHCGEQLISIKEEDEDYWLNHSGHIFGRANSGSSSAKRMFIELRNIRAGKVPFVSAVPLEDSLDKVLASTEGPPELRMKVGCFGLPLSFRNLIPLGHR